MTFLRSHVREALVAALSLAVVVLIGSGFFIHFDREGLFYFTTFRAYGRALFVTLVMLALFTAIPRLRPYRDIFMFFLVFFLGYFVADLLYRSCHVKLSVLYPGSPHMRAFRHMDYFLLHRAYQLIPLAVTLLFYFTYPKGHFTSFLRFGDMDSPTRVVGREADNWRRVTGFFVSILFGFLALMALVSPGFFRAAAASFQSGGFFLLLSIFFYSALAAFIEEVFFRGIFLSVFEKTLGERGNLYQAFLFGAIHFDITNPANSVLKLMLFVFLGWLWGRAAKETGGLGAPWLMHFAIIVALELRQNVFM